MCFGGDPPEAKQPAAPPPPPKPVEFGSKTSNKQDKKSNARASLSIPLNMGGTSGKSGLGIPS